MEKKALSNIIASVMLILLSITAVSLVSVSIRKQIDFSPQLSCFDLKLNSVSIEKSCYNQSSGITEITLNRKFNSKFKSIELSVKNSAGSSLYRIGEGCLSSSLLEEGETKTYLIQEKADSIILRIEDCAIESKKVSPC